MARHLLSMCPSENDAIVRVIEAARAYYVEPMRFLGAFGSNPIAAVVRLRDNPAHFGGHRTYLGAIHAGRLHTKLLAAARAHLTRTQGYAAARSTYLAKNAKSTLQ